MKIEEKQQNRIKEIYGENMQWYYNNFVIGNNDSHTFGYIVNIYILKYFNHDFNGYIRFSNFFEKNLVIYKRDKKFKKI